ncbi:hypothetical protein Bpfe_001062 [Biomphalaria pfeifferi]|uniref:Uncharacterized protein n=1 Tax=Biomphalaria pfeifferi TaxID=112525 RepID=A0AAD8CD83_BIOPF|nr:hypothetical protein Bpfe_001062 [Biomphalaria pfeifferi]
MLIEKQLLKENRMYTHFESQYIFIPCVHFCSSPIPKSAFITAHLEVLVLEGKGFTIYYLRVDRHSLTAPRDRMPVCSISHFKKRLVHDTMPQVIQVYLVKLTCSSDCDNW